MRIINEDTNNFDFRITSKDYFWNELTYEQEPLDGYDETTEEYLFGANNSSTLKKLVSVLGKDILWAQSEQDGYSCCFYELEDILDIISTSKKSLVGELTLFTVDGKYPVVYGVPPYEYDQEKSYRDFELFDTIFIREQDEDIITELINKLTDTDTN